MRYRFLLLLGLPILIFSIGREAMAQTAKAELSNVKGEKVGSATLTQETNGVKITLEVSHLTPGEHAFHVHSVGKCEPPDFTSAGGHFNPYGKKHGHMNPEGAHAGDLPNVVIAEDGNGGGEVIVEGVTLGDGENSLSHPEGTSLVIHENADDEVTDPAGNAGPRVACGVIRKV
ncbi:MAG: superoxide dismutase family protein [Candidatus Omnitrophica bacterium]|nr:superoxide dismutase family protein [Candidatus Omnitrophota bacterium]